MEALILSCGTGGGHNMAGKAVADKLKNRGHTVTFMDPYQLVGKNTADHVGNLYIKLVQRSPKVFGWFYSMGESYRKFRYTPPYTGQTGRLPLPCSSISMNITTIALS